MYILKHYIEIYFSLIWWLFVPTSGKCIANREKKQAELILQKNTNLQNFEDWSL